MGVPSLGMNVVRERMNRLMGDTPGPEVLGTVAPEHLDEHPQGSSAQWETPTGQQISMDEGPPPWELEDGDYSASDARRYVEVPKEWTLRWINPKLLESEGWRYWRAVSYNDSRVKVKVDQMLIPDGTIRRGGATGDILAYMPTHWVESRRKMLHQRTAEQTAAAVNRTESLKEEFRRGTYGPYVGLDSATHPSHTQFDGRSIRD